MERCCPSLDAETLGAEAAADLAATLSVLADPTRLRLLNLISAAGEACVCDLIAPLGVSQPTVSHHLKVLRQAGFVMREQRGKWAYYSANREILAQVATALAPVPNPIG